MYIYRACKLCFCSFFNVLRNVFFARASKKTAGIVLCRSFILFYFILFHFVCFVLYLPDMALWTKGTFQKDLIQVFETQTSTDFQQVHLTLSYLLNSIQTET